MIIYRGVKAFNLGLGRWRFIFSSDCTMDYICRDGIEQVIKKIDFYLDTYGGIIW